MQHDQTNTTATSIALADAVLHQTGQGGEHGNGRVDQPVSGRLMMFWSYEVNSSP